MSESEHTPLPWYIADYHPALINSTQGSVASCVTMPDCEDEDEANARFIVRACNSHDDLLEACESLLTFLKNDNPGGFEADAYMAGLADKAEAAIRRATEGV